MHGIFGCIEDFTENIIILYSLPALLILNDMAWQPFSSPEIFLCMCVDLFQECHYLQGVPAFFSSFQKFDFVGSSAWDLLGFQPPQLQFVTCMSKKIWKWFWSDIETIWISKLLV